MSEKRPAEFFLAEITGRHLFAAARSMLDEGHYGPAVVIAQSAVEVGMARAISFGLSADVPDALQTWIEEETVDTWSPTNERVQRLWRAVTDDAITGAMGGRRTSRS